VPIRYSGVTHRSRVSGPGVLQPAIILCRKKEPDMDNDGCVDLIILGGMVLFVMACIIAALLWIM